MNHETSHIYHKNKKGKYERKTTMIRKLSPGASFIKDLHQILLLNKIS